MVKGILKKREVVESDAFADLGYNYDISYVGYWADFESTEQSTEQSTEPAYCENDLEKVEKQGAKRVTWLGGILFKPVLNEQNGLTRHWKDWFDRYGYWDDFGTGWKSRAAMKSEKKTRLKQLGQWW
jgi:hypothetical protein